LETSGLPEAARAAARIVWSRRCSNEQASVDLAERLATTSRALTEAPEEHAGLAKAFARLEEDERGHVAITFEVLGALGASLPAAQPIEGRRPGEPLGQLFARDVAVGLLLCEAVSASRFASVWAATDLPDFRERIAIFLRDEVAHARLGAVLLPEALRLLAREQGEEDARAYLRHEVTAAALELKRLVAHDVAPADLPPRRPQPRENPGVVEPALDAHAYYRALFRFVFPALASVGIALDAGALCARGGASP
jgi:hypothetical protein